MQEVALSMIVAMTPERVIGNDGKLLWYLPSDLARFKKITMIAGTMVMGGKTFRSIIDRNGKPLSGRKHIVLTRRNIFSEYESVQFVSSLEEACKEIVKCGKRACIIGGGEIFKIFLLFPQVKTVLITTVYTPGEELIGDVYFPEISTEEGWRCEKSSAIRQWNKKDEYETSFALYKRS